MEKCGTIGLFANIFVQKYKWVIEIISRINRFAAYSLGQPLSQIISGEIKYAKQ